MRPVLGTMGFALEEGDPLPPAHDRVEPAPDILDAIPEGGTGSVLLPVPQEREDVIQMFFSRMAGKSRSEHVTIAAPGTYLRQAASNVLRDEAKSVERTSQARHVPVEDVVVAGADPILALEAPDRLAHIEQTVSRLKPLTREMVLACRLVGYSYAEIAERTGLSVKGVGKQMSRAIKQVGRQLWANEGFPRRCHPRSDP